MNNRLTIVTPSFEKHFLQFSRMIKSISDNCIDKENLEVLVVVEEGNVDKFYGLSEEYDSISMKIVTTESVLTNFGINESPRDFLKRIGKFTFQTLKKFGGILAADTHWTLVLDSETVFHNRFSASELLKNYSELKYVFYTKTNIRGEQWNNSLGFRVNKNTAKALKIEKINRWYMDILCWFYEKNKVEDLLFNKLGGDWLNNIIKSKEEIDYFEPILYYAYINHYHNDEYKILDLEKELKEVTEPDISGRFNLNQLPFSIHGNDFLLSTVGVGDINKLTPFFEKFKLPFIRLEPSYVDENYIHELMKIPYFTAVISTQYLMWMEKRIAICLSGNFTHNEFRGYEQQVRNLLGFLSGVNYDLYVHGWKQSCEAYIIDILKPKKYLFEEQIDFNDLVKEINSHESSYRKPGRDHGTMSMFYSMEKAFSLIENFNNYDYVVRLRPDIYSIFSLKEIMFSISDNGDLLPNTIYIPSAFQAKGMNDQFAIGRVELMNKYFSTYSYIKKNIEHLFFNPESILLKNMIDNGIGISLLDMPYALHRGQEMRPWVTNHLLNEQEKVWWSCTTNIVKLQDLSNHFKHRFISGKLLNSYPKNIRFLGKIKNEKYMVLVETHDFDSHVHVRACFEIFGLLFPWKVKSLEMIKSYEHPHYSSYYCIDIDSNNKLKIHQLISDWKSIKESTISCDSYISMNTNDYKLVTMNISVFCIRKIRENISRIKRFSRRAGRRIINRIRIK